jgi:hypothetical protein
VPWRPAFPGEVPSLGFEVLEWMSWALAAPDRAEYEPFVPTLEQAQFVVNLYALDPRTGRRRFRRAVMSRPKGWGKSPFLAAIALAEALAPVVPDGWDAAGRPVARAWSDLRTPWVQLMAVSEDQTRNAWAPLLEMLRNGPACDLYPGLEPLDTFVNLPAGRIEAVTASAVSREGNRPVCAILDQTESWTPTNGGVRLAATTRRNLGKTGGVSIEAPNAYRPGMDSVAQASAEYAALIRAGKAKDEGLLYDHREAPAGMNLADRDSLLEGLRYVYGDSHWVDLERIVAEVWDPATDPQDARQYYGNMITHASDSWLSQPEWAGCADATKHLADRELVTLGFDGSVRDDTTALVACRVSDGHLELLGCWEPRGSKDDAQVDREAVDAAVEAAFGRFDVAGMYCDPALWQDYVDRWTQRFGVKVRQKASANRPLEWWTNRPTAMVAALERFHTAVLGGQLSHDGGSLLASHILNARRRESRSGTVIGKEAPKSARKIDAAMAAVLAYECRCDAVASGVTATRRKAVPKRIF